MSELFYLAAPVKQAIVCRQKQRGVPLITAELPAEGKVSKDFFGMCHSKTRRLFGTVRYGPVTWIAPNFCIGAARPPNVCLPIYMWTPEAYKNLKEP